MSYRIVPILKNHSSLLALFVFSGCYFLSSVVARKLLDDNAFYTWNVIITVIGISFSFCFFGSEQILLRTSRVVSGRLVVGRSVVAILLISLFIYTILLVYVSFNYFFDFKGPYLYLVIALAVGFFVFFYNIFRLQKRYFISQVAANGWKVVFLLSVFGGYFVNVEHAFIIGMLLSILIVMAFVFKNGGSIEVASIPLPSDWKNLFLGYALALFSLMLINNIDRLIVGRQMTAGQFSDFVYLVTILLMPFSLLANYIGFRELPLLKTSFFRGDFIKKLVNTIFLTAAVFAVWFGVIYALRNILEVNVKIIYIFPAMVIVCLRSSYALLSALFGLRGSAREIQIANVISIVFIVIFSLILVRVGVSISAVLYLTAGIWVSRFFIYLLFTRKISNYVIEEAG